jgi:hypothetical protein
MTATGNERSSTSFFVSGLCPAVLVVGSLTRASSIASLILCSALAIISLYSGVFRSVVFRSSCCTCLAASGVKGYFAQSVGVRIRFCPSVRGCEPLLVLLRLLFYFNAGCEIKG